MAIKREANVSGPIILQENLIFTGELGISLQKKNWQTSLFISSRKISTNLEPDTLGREDLFSSFQQSGYHRTPAEIADRNNNRQILCRGQYPLFR